MSEIHVSCTDQVLKITVAPTLASGGMNEVTVIFDFCEKWDGYIKTATFYRNEEDVYYSVLDDNDTCVVPWEVCGEDGSFYFSVFGENGTTRRTATTVRYKVVKGAITSDYQPSDPTPTMYDQILGMVTECRDNAQQVEDSAKQAEIAAVTAAESAVTAAESSVEAKAAANKAASAASEALDTANEAKEALGEVNEQIDKLNAEVFPITNLFDPSTSTAGYIAGAGGAISAGSGYFTTDFIPVAAGQSIWFTPQIRKFLAYTEAKKPFSTSYVANTTQDYVYTATENCYVRVTYETSYQDAFRIEYVENGFHRLRIASFGDSIAFGDGNKGVGIADVVANLLYARVWEYAKGGATIGWDATDAESTSPDIKRQNIQHQVTRCISEHTEAPDIILLDGGTNDNGHGVALGEISTGYDAELDNTTYCGGLETIFKDLKNAYPEAMLIFVVAHRMGGYNNEKQDSFAEKAIQICNKWSVGVADVFHRSNLNTFLSAYYKYTNNEDKTHPTQEGYEKFYLPIVMDEIQKLMRLN